MVESESCGHLNIYQLYKVIEFHPVICVFFFFFTFFYSWVWSAVNSYLKQFISAELLFRLHVNEKNSDVSEMNPFR